MSRMKHPYAAGDQVKALWFLTGQGTCLVPAEVTATKTNLTRSHSPYGITLTYQGDTHTAWVRANGTDIHQYIAPAKG